jgi:CubicO group peptidase (beta-lactamase class C family)
MISFTIPPHLNSSCLLALIAVFGLSSCEERQVSEPEPTSPETETASFSPAPAGLTELIESQAGENRGFLAYVRFDDGTEWAAHAGTRAVGGEKVTGQEKFKIGSVSKLFTAVSILQLSETDRLDLEAPLTDYFDRKLLAILVGGDRGNVDALKVRQLLTHTTGMGDYINIGSDAAALALYGTAGDRTYKPMELIGLTKSYTEDPSQLPSNHHALPYMTLADLKENASYDDMPGALYSNTGYIMLGLIIEKCSGMTYEDYVSTHIFDPLGMEDSGFGTKGAKSDFTCYATGISEDPVAMSPSFAWSAGAIVTTTRDLADFFDAARSGKLFKNQETLARQPKASATCVRSKTPSCWQCATNPGNRTPRVLPLADIPGFHFNFCYVV